MIYLQTTRRTMNRILILTIATLISSEIFSTNNNYTPSPPIKIPGSQEVKAERNIRLESITLSIIAQRYLAVKNLKNIMTKIETALKNIFLLEEIRISPKDPEFKEKLYLLKLQRDELYKEIKTERQKTKISPDDLRQEIEELIISIKSFIKKNQDCLPSNLVSKLLNEQTMFYVLEEVSKKYLKANQKFRSFYF